MKTIVRQSPQAHYNRVHIHSKNPNATGLVPEEDRFWGNFQADMDRLMRRYPLDAHRRHSAEGIPGEWIITGPDIAVSHFRTLAEAAAQRIGYRGGPLGAVQFWLDHIFGDHMIKKSYTHTPVNTREALYTNKDGSKTAYRGRHEYAGEARLLKDEKPTSGSASGGEATTKTDASTDTPSLITI
jgi:hypothetical protein